MVFINIVTFFLKYTIIDISFFFLKIKILEKIIQRKKKLLQIIDFFIKLVDFLI